MNRNLQKMNYLPKYLFRSEVENQWRIQDFMLGVAQKSYFLENKSWRAKKRIIKIPSKPCIRIINKKFTSKLTRVKESF